MDGAEDSVEVVGGDGCEWSGKIDNLAIGVYGRSVQNLYLYLLPLKLHLGQ